MAHGSFWEAENRYIQLAASELSRFISTTHGNSVYVRLRGLGLGSKLPHN